MLNTASAKRARKPPTSGGNTSRTWASETTAWSPSPACGLMSGSPPRLTAHPPRLPITLPRASRTPPTTTKLKLAVEVVQRALQADCSFGAGGADSCYGEDRGVRQGLRDLNVGSVLALEPLPHVLASHWQQRILGRGRPGCRLERCRPSRRVDQSGADLS